MRTRSINKLSSSQGDWIVKFLNASGARTQLQMMTVSVKSFHTANSSKRLSSSSRRLLNSAVFNVGSMRAPIIYMICISILPLFLTKYCENVEKKRMRGSPGSLLRRHLRLRSDLKLKISGGPLCSESAADGAASGAYRDLCRR
jgi:hypothetical protein